MRIFTSDHQQPIHVSGKGHVFPIKEKIKYSDFNKILGQRVQINEHEYTVTAMEYVRGCHGVIENVAFVVRLK